MRARWQSTVVLFALGVAGGCGDSGSDEVIPLGDLPPRLAQALCSAYQTCYGPVFDLFLNGADCVATTEHRIRNGTFPMLQGEIDQGKVGYDGSKAQACLDSVSTRTCAEMLERDSDECLAALDGTVPLGGACTLDEECQGRAVCRSSTGICPGQCTGLLVAGQACVQDGDCQSGLQCSSETKLCVAPAAEGQPCEYGAPPCGPGLLCLGKDDDNKAPGVCETPAAALSAPAGGVCDPTNGQLCQVGSSCALQGVDALAGTIDWSCVPVGTYLAGGDCKPGFPDACASGHYCKTGGDILALLGGTCTLIPAAGEACGNGMSQCQPGAVCVSGICQNLVSNGVSCAADDMCFSGYCGSSGGCEPRLPCR
jgi:hypothetical protein